MPTAPTGVGPTTTDVGWCRNRRRSGSAACRRGCWAARPGCETRFRLRIADFARRWMKAPALLSDLDVGPAHGVDHRLAVEEHLFDAGSSIIAPRGR